MFNILTSYKRPSTRVALLLGFLSIGLLNCSSSESEVNRHDLNEDQLRIQGVLQRATFENLEGETVQLSDYKGKIVLVDFWETWCSPCLMVFPAMDSLRTEYGDQFEVLAVNTILSDNPASVAKFAEDNPYDFNWVVDVNGVGEQVISMGIPFKVYVDTAGYVITTELGSRGTQGDYEKTKSILEAYLP
jgi:thiol-disulfide isomerase/thioredoxin